MDDVMINGKLEIKLDVDLFAVQRGDKVEIYAYAKGTTAEVKQPLVRLA